ncbi:MAG TPA: hypothetical protein VL860_11200, partial [Planctomycetota bacterium]|nr:hypothetical protein [Planctomycetota bacterium]
MALGVMAGGCGDPPAVSVETLNLQLSCPGDMALVQATSYKSGPWHAPRAAGDPAGAAPVPPETAKLLASEIPVPAYCIDRYAQKPEAGLLVSFGQAEQLCRAQGKQLCTPYQWERACRGQTMGRFPYGSRFDAACLTPGLAQCQSSYGV